jgi:3-oxoacyl-[acyl-carrier-protein] synthase-1
LSNPTETRFIDSGGGWIMAHQVPLERPWSGRTRLAKMGAMAIAECLAQSSRADWPQIPLLLCVAEQERPSRSKGLDDELFNEIQQELNAEFAEQSRVIPHGRVSVAVALAHARRLISDGSASLVLIAASDSLLSWPTLRHYEQTRRLLTSDNSNGFIPGEGAGAILVAAATGNRELLCSGIGFGVEAAHIGSEHPLRGDGLSKAIKAALTDAGREMGDMDMRITDLGGEHYYFKEAALALARTLRTHKKKFDIWHPAECIGEQGAVAGLAVVALADAACKKAFCSGPRILAHMANDAGQRAALAFEFRVAP